MSAVLHGVTLRCAYSAGTWLRDCTRAALVLPLALLGCSSVALPQTEVPTTGPDEAAFHKIVGDYLKDSFKEISTYDSFEISDARWVHTVKGWSWVSCVRFRDRAHIRTYAVFIQADKVVESRYAVTTDDCGKQTYVPFDAISNTERSPNSIELDPLH